MFTERLTIQEQANLMRALMKLCKAACEGETHIRNYIELHGDSLVKCWAVLGPKYLLDRVVRDDDQELAPKVERLIAMWRQHVRDSHVPNDDVQWLAASERLLESANQTDGSVWFNRHAFANAVKVASQVRAKYVMFDLGRRQVIVDVTKLVSIMHEIKRSSSLRVGLSGDAFWADDASSCQYRAQIHFRWGRVARGRLCLGGLNIWAETVADERRYMREVEQLTRECAIVKLGYEPYAIAA